MMGVAGGKGGKPPSSGWINDDKRWRSRREKDVGRAVKARKGHPPAPHACSACFGELAPRANSLSRSSYLCLGKTRLVSNFIVSCPETDSEGLTAKRIKAHRRGRRRL